MLVCGPGSAKLQQARQMAALGDTASQHLQQHWGDTCWPNLSVGWIDAYRGLMSGIRPDAVGKLRHALFQTAFSTASQEDASLLEGGSVTDRTANDVKSDFAWTPTTRRHHSRAGLRYETDLTDAERAVIAPLMPEPASCGRPLVWTDNAMAESYFSALEYELLARRRFCSQADARMACFSYIEGFYHPLRRHSALDYRSPVVYEQKTGPELPTETLLDQIP